MVEYSKVQMPQQGGVHVYLTDTNFDLLHTQVWRRGGLAVSVLDF